MFVKDYKGKLIPKAKARRIKEEDGSYRYYEVDVSCILMSDGKWYRTTTGKIVYDHSTSKWIFGKNFAGSIGLVEDGSVGHFTDISGQVDVLLKSKIGAKKTVFDPASKELVETTGNSSTGWSKAICMNEKVAEKLGFVESIYDGKYYKLTDCNAEDRTLLETPNIPQSERTNVYSLDDDRESRIKLEDLYDSNDIKIDRDLSLIAKRHIPFSFG